MSAHRTALLFLTLAAGLALAPAAELPADHAERMSRGLELFRGEVGPALKSNCLSCHGGEHTKGDLDLATRESLLRGGVDGPVVKPFSAAESTLVKRLRHEVEPGMPFKKPRLEPALIEVFSRWIDLGAPYEAPLIAGRAAARDKSRVTDMDRAWWAFQPLSRVEPPAGAHPVDAFLLQKAAGRRLGLAPEADRRTQLRRLTLDLTGIPPTPEEMAEFLKDRSRDAWTRAIDRLLASPRHGERWARHWLDVARFAESSGFEHDYDRPNAWRYRDFVIRALNEDLPFDQFARWQVAGDEFDPGNPMAMIATGFLGAGVFPTQITANEVERTRYDALDDMLSTTSSAFLGLTVGCARCHDHKFDPIPAADYYAMLSSFTTTVRSQVDLELDPERAAADRRRHAEEGKRLESAQADYELHDLKPRFEAWLTSGNAVLPASSWRMPKVESLVSRGGAKFASLGDGSWLASGANPGEDTYVVTLAPAPGRLTGVKLEALAHESFPSKGPGRAGNGNFALSRIRATLSPAAGGEGRDLKIRSAVATHQQNTNGLSAASSLDSNPKSGWAVDLGGIGKDQAAVFTLAEPVELEAGAKLVLTLEFQVNTSHTIGRPRFSVTDAPSPSLDGDGVPEAVAALEPRLRNHASLQPAERETLFAWWRTRDDGWRKHASAVAAHGKKAPSATSPVLVCAEGYKPVVMHSQGPPFLEKTHVLRRGDPGQKGAVATQGVLQVLNRDTDMSRWRWDPPQGARYSGRRRGLANWMVDVDHGAGALMARVAVNRLWQHHFGRGLVATPNDFGKTGAAPSHPELLDWLAGELVRNGWKLKPIHRLMLTSAAYRQSASADAARLAADPDNELFLRRTPSRLEGEAIRDGMLAVSGLLDPTLYGPGTLDESSLRRSVYFTVKRSELVNSMVVFDAPEPLGSQGRRPATTVAPQALLLMNSPQARRWAAALAQRVLKEAPRSPVNRAYQLALARNPTPAESRLAESFLATGKAGGEEQAWTDFCQTLLSLNEFAYVP